MKKFVHCLGLACLASAISLEVLMFIDIVSHGYFLVIESNLSILRCEVLLIIFTIIYFGFLCVKILK